MQRVLDLDLDFFVQRVVFWPPDDQRADPEEHKVALGVDTLLEILTDAEIELVGGDLDAFDGVGLSMRYLRERLGLRDSLPGAAVETHDEVFAIWERMIRDGELRCPFHVTHVDAHGDFGKGQLSHRKVLTEVLALPADARRDRSRNLLNEGDYLLHAVACRWVADIDYVFCPGGGSDIDRWYWEDFRTPPLNEHGRSGVVRLAGLDEPTLDAIVGGATPRVDYDEPPVCMREIQQHAYATTRAFDFAFLARSPRYTPFAADPLYDAIRTEFIAGLRAN